MVAEPDKAHQLARTLEPMTHVSIGGNPGVSPERPLPQEVLPGLWKLVLPLPLRGLSQVFVYALTTPSGTYLIDCGWDSDDSLRALNSSLELLGSSLGEVRGVLITHAHPDHIGGAHRVRETSGAWIALHEADTAVLTSQRESEETLRVHRWLDEAGVPLDLRRDWAEHSFRPWSRPENLPDRSIREGRVQEVPGWNLQAIWTPGHTPGHVCFQLPDVGLTITGDHVLPNITPNVSYDMFSRDPLGDYITSLERVRKIGGRGLAAHEHDVHDVAQRASALIAHHEERFAEVLNAVEDGDATPWAVAQRMTWSVPWESITAGARSAAIREAFAHVIALGSRGWLHRDTKDVAVWHLTAQGREASRRPQDRAHVSSEVRA